MPRLVVYGLPLLAGLLLPLLSPVVARFPEGLRWVLDLAVHWQFLFSLLWTGLVLGFAFRRRRPVLLIGLLVGALPWATGQGAHVPSAEGRPRSNASAAWTVATFNVNLRNEDAARALQWLSSVNAEVAVLHEVTPAFAEKLESWTEASHSYPHRYMLPREGPFGMAILSKHPLQAPLERQVVEGQDPVVEAVVVRGVDRIRIVGLHPMPPVIPAFARERDEYLLREVRLAASLETPTVFAGDFNATVWSSAFAGIQAAGWRTAVPWGGTWHSALPSWLGIGIDHVVVDTRWSAVSRQIGPDLGSDHRPVVVTIQREH